VGIEGPEKERKQRMTKKQNYSAVKGGRGARDRRKRMEGLVSYKEDREGIGKGEYDGKEEGVPGKRILGGRKIKDGHQGKEKI